MPTEPVSDAALTEPPKGAAAPGSAINPYALAEVVSGRRIDWKHVDDKPALLEQILGTPYEELFDPKHGGPLYIGGARQEDGSMRAQRSSLLDIEVPKGANDVEHPPIAELGGLTTLKDIARTLRLDTLDSLAVHCIDWTHATKLKLTFELPRQVSDLRMARHYTPDIVRTVSFDPKMARLGNAQDWTPPNASWQDGGRFFDETAEFFDPVQGAVANCYFIAALSAVAWSQPYRIAQQTRATGMAQSQFFDRVTFYKPDNQGIDREIEVSETVPKTAGGNFIYARSSEPTEAWPAVYEKAFAKLKTGTTTDHPDITATGWGDCVWATAQLTGGKRAYYDTASRSADQLWNTLRSHCLSYRTIRPMTAWTYGSGADAPDPVDYSSANVVGSHCYTVLGWAYRNCKRYILLRNPWGNTEATVGSLDATVSAYDVSWWRPITLKDTDGTFAMEIGTFKRYFAGFGVVS